MRESVSSGERDITRLSRCGRCDAFWYPQDYSACPNCKGVRATGDTLSEDFCQCGRRLMK